MNRNQLTILFSALALFISAIGYNLYVNRENNLKAYQAEIETYLHTQEREVEAIMTDHPFIHRITGAEGESLTQRNSDLEKLKNLAAEDFTIYITVKDSIIFWNNNLTSLPEITRNFDSGDRRYEFIKDQNGFYELISQTNLDPTLGQYNIHALIPIKYNYRLDSDYIKDQFIANDQIPNLVSLSDEYTDFPVYNNKEKLLFYLDAPENLIDTSNQRTLIFLWFVGFILLGYFIHLTTLKIQEQSLWAGSLFLIGTVFLIRWLSISRNWLGQFDNLFLFSKNFDSFWVNSIGDMLIDSSLLLWIMVFFHQTFPTKINENLSAFSRFAMSVFGYVMIFLSFFFLTRVFKGIVFDSNLNHDFNNVFNLEWGSIFSIVAVVIFLTGLLIFCHRIIMITSQLVPRTSKRIFAILLANILVLPVLFSNEFLIHWSNLLSISLSLILFFDIFVDRKKLNFLWLILLLGILAGFPSFLLFMYNTFLDHSIRHDYARELSVLEDRYAEKAFGQLITDIQSDREVAQLLSIPIPNEEDTQEFISTFNKYFSSKGYIFHNYSYNVNGFDENHNPILTNQRDDYNSIKEKIKSAKPTKQRGVFIWENPEELEWSYFLEVPVSQIGSDATQSVFFEFVRDRREQSKVYTELLVDQPYKQLKRLNKYDFAVYKNKKRIDSKGKIYGPLLTIDNLPPPGESVAQSIGNRTEVLYLSKDQETVVVIGRDKESFIKAISLFSYMLTIMVSIIFLALLFNSFFKFFPNALNIFTLKTPALKDKIQLAVVILTLSSFLSIGLTTFWFFKNSSEEYHEKRLERKASSVLTDAQREIERMDIASSNTAIDKTRIKSILKPVSETHRLDINLYDLDGKLIGSSEDDLYDRGVISRQMGAVAFQALSRHQRSHYTQDGEHIGNLVYKAAYVPLRGRDDKPIAYMGLPYYSKQSKMSNDVTLFMSTLINVYVFLLFIAGGVAMLTARSITKHLSAIGEKLKETKLGKRNTPLDWQSDDEIGALIKEYNKMIKQLEKSADKLAQSEREGAWREMAKQVAHEIKNPLTPMKLSIQYLEHAFRSQPENGEQLLKRVSATLIEQIDNLSQIASEFSNFAKMPQAENQNIILNHHVQSVYNLFRSEDVDLKLDMPKENYVVFADKNHLVRVFNNLIKNAIQAIPDDRHGIIKVSMYQEADGDHILVCVDDNGTGIPKDKQDKVFVPNFTTKNSGTGLGLAISKNIIESVNGRIWFETIENIGTKFFVELPIEEVAAEELEDIV